ncbi:tumor necrosis factor receptor superfamily member 10A-like isoform X4 [Bos indicus x Bos taurus]|uniref:tumor necrosis factor receptor superfamily member 10A-like isoform X4 n=1 Tax=Bos indicus x Bos taurus TaxID=30522 RepID=UPI000F7D28E1|nr:tumor necrosis factor receptor superfamily member 10A-like isoform X4 [Bos indicus x Bos taurus]
MTINLRGPRQRTLPDRKGQHGRRAPASSIAGGPRLRFGYLVFVMGVVLRVKAASAMSVRKDEIHQQSSAPLERSPQQKLCPPGFYMEEAIRGCAPCTDGIDYTNHSNTLPSCLLCTTCKSGEEEKNRCTPTKDTECQCKPGTFRGEDAPEFCQKCSTGCPDGKIMVMDCTPWSNINCVDQESGPPSRLMIAIIVIGLVITAVLIGCMVWCCLKDSECPACSHRPRALCSVSEPPTCTLSLGREVRQECPPHHSVDVSSLLGLFNECWHKVIGFSSIWRPQTLSNCITTKPRVDTVSGKEADRRQRPVPRCSKQTACWSCIGFDLLMAASARISEQGLLGSVL